MFKRLYAFHGGSEYCSNCVFDTQSADPDGISEIPYFFYLIEHSNGFVAFDTGVNLDLIRDMRSYLGPHAQDWKIYVRPDDDVRSQLGKIGVDIKDVKTVVLSHLHYDHAGGMNLFENAVFLVQRDEWDFALNPPNVQQNSYVRSEYDVPAVRLRLIGGEFDIFGDGTLILVPTPGHTKGHQSLLIAGRASSYILAADAAYVPDLEDISRLPVASLIWSKEALIESRMNLRRLRDRYNAKVICTHDGDFRNSLNLAPAFYA